MTDGVVHAGVLPSIGSGRMDYALARFPSEATERLLLLALRDAVVTDFIDLAQASDLPADLD